MVKLKRFLANVTQKCFPEKMFAFTQLHLTFAQNFVDATANTEMFLTWYRYFIGFKTLHLADNVKTISKSLCTDSSIHFSYYDSSEYVFPHKNLLKTQRKQNSCSTLKVKYGCFFFQK